MYHFLVEVYRFRFIIIIIAMYRKKEIKTVKGLKKDHSVLVIKADKSSATVVMNITDYNNKITNDKTYAIINKNPVNKI